MPTAIQGWMNESTEKKKIHKKISLSEGTERRKYISRPKKTMNENSQTKY
jgi:hypothetical protein